MMIRGKHMISSGTMPKIRTHKATIVASLRVARHLVTALREVRDAMSRTTFSMATLRTRKTSITFTRHLEASNERRRMGPRVDSSTVAETSMGPIVKLIAHQDVRNKDLALISMLRVGTAFTTRVMDLAGLITMVTETLVAIVRPNSMLNGASIRPQIVPKTRRRENSMKSS